jgi:hypothetical protein
VWVGEKDIRFFPFLGKQLVPEVFYPVPGVDYDYFVV